MNRLDFLQETIDHSWWSLISTHFSSSDPSCSDWFSSQLMMLVCSFTPDFSHTISSPCLNGFTPIQNRQKLFSFFLKFAWLAPSTSHHNSSNSSQPKRASPGWVGLIVTRSNSSQWKYFLRYVKRTSSLCEISTRVPKFPLQKDSASLKIV